MGIPAISLLIKENKQRIQNTIDHYHRNLPPTFITTKNVVKNTRTIKDITFDEVKNTTIIDPFDAANSKPIISSESGKIQDDNLFLIPGFFRVNHRKKMNKSVWSVYSSYVSKNKKNRDLHAIHFGALNAAIDEITNYIKWVEKNNDMLVKKHPEMFSYKSPVEQKEEAVEKPKSSFIDKMKNKLNW